MFRIIEHALNWTCPALHNGAKALFFDRRQAAGNIARRRLTSTHVASDALGAGLHVIDDFINLIGDFFRNSVVSPKMTVAPKSTR